MSQQFIVAALVQSAALNSQRDNYCPASTKLRSRQNAKMPAEASMPIFGHSCASIESSFEASAHRVRRQEQVARKQAAADRISRSTTCYQPGRALPSAGPPGSKHPSRGRPRQHSVQHQPGPRRGRDARCLPRQRCPLLPGDRPRTSRRSIRGRSGRRSSRVDALASRNPMTSARRPPRLRPRLLFGDIPWPLRARAARNSRLRCAQCAVRAPGRAHRGRRRRNRRSASRRVVAASSPAGA